MAGTVMSANHAGQWLKATVPYTHATKLTMDSRAVKAGDVFFAIPGATVDGRQYIHQAIANGAAAVVWDSDQFNWSNNFGSKTGSSQLPNVGVDNLKQNAGYIANDWYGQPSARLHVIAYTGTSGKTSCTTWCSQLLAQLGQRCAVIGTRGIGEIAAKAELTEAGLTTPQALELAAAFANFVDGGVQSVAVEASSIGLEEGRLNGTSVTTAVFTNLTRDHLDYHGSMQAYALAKAKLFKWPTLKTAVINVDDQYADIMSQAVEPSVLKILVSTQAIEKSPLPHSNVRRLFAQQIQFQGAHTVVDIGGDYGQASITLEMAGLFNVANVLTVMACALAQGFAFDAVIGAVQTLRPVEGRMQTVSAANQPLVIVDYAHKPDALEKVLQALRAQADARGGQLWCVMGCGGDRDPGKRPIMGAIAQELADYVVITSDNPRSENPQDILNAIASGMTSNEQVHMQVDRRLAIHYALEHADLRDIVLVAGKGHETYQEILGRKLPFSDLEVVREIFASSAVQGVAC